MTTQVHEVFIRTTPARVWAALTEPALTEQYFFGSRVRSSWQPGAPIVYDAGEGGPVMVEGTIEAIVAQARLQHTWIIRYAPGLDGETSRVAWSIEARGENVKLVVRHELEGAPASAAHLEHDAWSLVLSSLKSLLETGEALCLAA